MDSTASSSAGGGGNTANNATNHAPTTSHTNDPSTAAATTQEPQQQQQGSPNGGDNDRSRANQPRDHRPRPSAAPRAHHGRGGRGGRTGKKRDMGRSEWSKQKGDKRQRNEDEQAAKKRRLDEGEQALPIYATKFTEEVLKGEERRPKKKVAVLIGYAGTGYKGMQLTHDQKTIEGDLFQAFVAAGAISKANADDPKKSSFVRCARTDKGVHAAGNLISLKLIVEDDDIVKKINDNLVSQIRVWGFERTNNSFSAYQMVDSRIYEYLIPTYSFLPPHPASFLGRQCEEWAERKGEVEDWNARQEEVRGYWDKVDDEAIKPILMEYDEKTRDLLEKALYLRGDESGKADINGIEEEPNDDVETESKSETIQAGKEDTTEQSTDTARPDQVDGLSDEKSSQQILSDAVKRLRQAYITAKRTYRISPQRLERIQQVLNMYVGTRNYHNYTVAKTFRDPSSKRIIKSFTVNSTPILINGTEWLSMKVHGQSFMMHQIRKMVGMAALIVRCGSDPTKTMMSSFGPANFSIPKAPSLGLLLERPVFDSYNHRAKKELGKEDIDFDKYRAEMDEFKQREIYERMYRDEEKDNVFGNFFNHVDNFPEPTFLFVTAGGVDATKADEGVEKAKKHALSASSSTSVAAAALLAGNVDDDDDAADMLANDANGDEG